MQAHQFGIIDVDAEGRIVGFIEKPERPPGMPGRPDWSLVSMGNYLFRTRVLQEVLSADVSDSDSSHDFGRDIIPRLVRSGARAYIYDFTQNQVPGEPSAAPARSRPFALSYSRTSVHRARSPVRYSRAPGLPENGSGTKRSAVSAARPR